MEYSKYRFKAQVDWIEIRVTTERTSNMPHIRGILDSVDPERRHYVTGDLNSDTVFSFKIQDPKSAAEVVGVISRLAKKVPIVETSVIGIELAFDAYAKQNTTRQDLAEMVAQTFVFAERTATKEWRRYLFHRELAPHLRRRDVVASLLDGWNVARGEQEDENALAQRWYLKTTDANKQPIPEAEHRARYEITLRGEHCPVKTLADLAQFDFHTVLGDWFKFRVLRDNLEPLQQLIAEKCDGAPLYSYRPHRRTDGKGWRDGSPYTTADSALNLCAKRALVSLSRRWCDDQPPKFSTTFEGVSPENMRDSGQSPNNLYVNRSDVLLPLLVPEGMSEAKTFIVPPSVVSIAVGVEDERSESASLIVHSLNSTPSLSEGVSEANARLVSNPGSDVFACSIVATGERSEPGILDTATLICSDPHDTS